MNPTSGASNMDPWQEYDSAAEHCAKRGLRGVIGDSLPMILSDMCYALIHNDPEAFERRVSETAYGLAMAKRNLPEET